MKPNSALICFKIKICFSLLLGFLLNMPLLLAHSEEARYEQLSLDLAPFFGLTGQGAGKSSKYSVEQVKCQLSFNEQFVSLESIPNTIFASYRRSILYQDQKLTRYSQNKKYIRYESESGEESNSFLCPLWPLSNKAISRVNYLSIQGRQLTIGSTWRCSYFPFVQNYSEVNCHF